jgi:hypothetical protein
MSINQNPAGVVDAGVRAAITLENAAVISATTKSIGEVRDVFVGGVPIVSIVTNKGTERVVEGICLAANTLVPPAVGSLVTHDSVVFMVIDAEVKETDAQEAMLTVTIRKYDGLTYAAPTPPP